MSSTRGASGLILSQHVNYCLSFFVFVVNQALVWLTLNLYQVTLSHLLRWLVGKEILCLDCQAVDSYALLI